MCALSAVLCTHQSHEISLHLCYTGYTTLRANTTEKTLIKPKIQLFLFVVLLVCLFGVLVLVYSTEKS